MRITFVLSFLFIFKPKIYKTQENYQRPPNLQHRNKKNKKQIVVGQQNLITCRLFTFFVTNICSKSTYYLQVKGLRRKCYCSMLLLNVIAQCYCSMLLLKVIAQCYCTMLLLNVIAQCYCSKLLLNVIAQCYCSMLLHNVIAQCYCSIKVRVCAKAQNNCIVGK